MNIQQVLFCLAAKDEQNREEVKLWLKSERHIEAIARNAKEGKIVIAVLKTLDAWGYEASVPASMRLLAADLERKNYFYQCELRELAESQCMLSQQILIPKGQAILRWYTEHLPRQSFDVDVVLWNEEQLWQLCIWLAGRGYNALEMPTVYPRSPRKDSWRFLITYEKVLINTDIWTTDQLVQFELLHGITSITQRYSFDFGSIIERAQNTSLKDSSQNVDALDTFFLYPTREDCLIIMLVEISERPLSLRDAVDFRMLTREISADSILRLDWQALRSRIEVEALVIQFLRLASYYIQVSRSPLSLEIAETYSCWRRQYPYWKLIAQYPILSVVAPYLAQHVSRTKTAREIFLSLCDIVLDHPLLEKLYLRSQSTVLRYHNSGQQRSLFRLLPVSTERKGPLQWHEGKGGELLLRTPIGVFLATRSIDFTEEFLENIFAHLPDEWKTSSPAIDHTVLADLDF